MNENLIKNNENILNDMKLKYETEIKQLKDKQSQENSKLNSEIAKINQENLDLKSQIQTLRKSRKLIIKKKQMKEKNLI